MKALVLGQGGREHALIRALSQSAKVTELHAIPGNDGMAKMAICHRIDWRDRERLLRFLKETKIELVIVGPEEPLVDGICDFLREEKFLVIGPGQNAARLEGSKFFSKQFMEKAGVPTAPFKVVQSVEDVEINSIYFTPPYVLKADGLAAGKGVYICSTKEDLLLAAREIFDSVRFGEAGKAAVLEQYQSGYEISYLVLTNGQDFQSLPLMQDHKRLADNDRGPNTGGMGVVGPMDLDRIPIEGQEANREVGASSDFKKIPSDRVMDKIDQMIVRPVIDEIHRLNWFYRGVLYFGIMITETGPSVLEFNVRFGDPEAQAILPLLDGDWAEVFVELAKGNLLPLSWTSMFAACVVLAAPGYPGHPKKGVAISGIEGSIDEDTRYLLHAGTQREQCGDGIRWRTGGGRVLNAIGLGETLSAAIQNAYSVAGSVSWDGLQMRNDIGTKLQLLLSGGNA